jgi:hypothetical protein
LRFSKPLHSTLAAFDLALMMRWMYVMVEKPFQITGNELDKKRQKVGKYVCPDEAKVRLKKETLSLSCHHSSFA